MKNRFVAILGTILLFSLLAVSALADTGIVNASSLNIRESASSKSDVIKVVKEGTKVEIKGKSGSWYKVSVGGKTGYTSIAGQCLASFASVNGSLYILVTAGAFPPSAEEHWNTEDALDIYSRYSK